MNARHPMRLVPAIAFVSLVTGCGSTVTVKDDGAGGSGASTTSASGGAGNTSSVGGAGGNPTGCPIEVPDDSDTCDTALLCTYGEECCCGECFPSIECSCFNGSFSCFSTDACFGPSCDICEHAECAIDCGAGPSGCGDTNSNFDAFGCLRQSCGTDVDCDFGQKCYTPFDFGGCAPSGIDCYVDEGGMCGCGSTADCGGSYCIPERIYPTPPPG